MEKREETTNELSHVPESEETSPKQRIKNRSFPFRKGSPDARGASSQNTKESITVQNYKLGEKLGTGALATVYKALNLQSGHFVAIKRIKRKKISEEALVREIKTLKQVSHPNIVKYLDLIISDNYLNLVLEFVDSGSLADVLQNYGVFPEPLVCVYIAQVLKGLEHLHSFEIVHRDIKGPNILITKEGKVKLADFGIAVSLKLDKSDHLQMNTMEGSPFWMAPELIQAKNQISKACDLWSLGCTILELLTGYPPYYDSSGITALYRMAQEDHPPFPEDISEELDNFLLKCFQKDPTKRPTATELLRHSWIQKAIKSDIKENWKNTLERVKKFNNKKRRATLNSIAISKIDWSQRPNKKLEEPQHEFHSQNVSPSESEPKEKEVMTNKINESKPPAVDITGTETRRNYIFSYTVYVIKVWHFVQEAKEYFIFRSYSDFRDLETKLKMQFPSEVAHNFPELVKPKWFGTMDPVYVEYLRIQLKDYLSKILEIPILSSSEALNLFLKED